MAPFKASKGCKCRHGAVDREKNPESFGVAFYDQPEGSCGGEGASGFAVHDDQTILFQLAEIGEEFFQIPHLYFHCRNKILGFHGFKIIVPSKIENLVFHFIDLLS